MDIRFLLVVVLGLALAVWLVYSFIWRCKNNCLRAGILLFAISASVIVFRAPLSRGSDTYGRSRSDDGPWQSYVVRGETNTQLMGDWLLLGTLGCITGMGLIWIGAWRASAPARKDEIAANENKPS